MVKYDYEWQEDGSVLKRRTPGKLYFLKNPMKFIESEPTDPRYSSMEKTVLRDIADFEVKAYSQEVVRDGEAFIPVIEPVTAPEKIDDAAFIVLRLHTRIDEQSEKKRDEELDIVTKFYSSVKLSEVANPGYFSSTDRDGRF